MLRCLVAAAIHMFFDCLALGMGLFASVMATWPSNNVYTYGWVSPCPVFLVVSPLST